MNFYSGCFRFQQTKTKLKTKTKRKKKCTEQNPPLSLFLISSFSPFKLLSFMPFHPSSSCFFFLLFQVLSLCWFCSESIFTFICFWILCFYFLNCCSFRVFFWICSSSLFSSTISPSSSILGLCGLHAVGIMRSTYLLRFYFLEFENFVVSAAVALSAFGLLSWFTCVFIFLKIFLSYILIVFLNF